MKYEPINNELFKKNREKLRKQLKSNSLVIIHSNDEPPKNGDQTYFPYRQNSDIFYLTGIDQEQTILTLCPDHPNEKMRELLFVIKTNQQMEVWYGHKYTKPEATELSGIEKVKWLDDFEMALNDLMVHSENVYLNTNENLKFVPQPQRDLQFVHQIMAKYPLHQYHRAAPIITDLRLKKETQEIELMKKACKITVDAFHRVLKFVRPGVMEYEIEAEMTHEFLRQGANSHAYNPIIASGKNACVLHYPDNDKECKDGDLILMDFGADYANYAADTTRTIPVNGKFTPRQREVYEAVLRVKRKAENLIRPGNTINKLNEEVNKIIEKEMIDLGLFTEDDVKNQDEESPMYFKYYMHGTSHFMGLDVHDVGSKDKEFEPGMVMSCEPGIYIPDENLGVRLEDDILVTEGDPVNLFENHPIEPDELEALMAK